MHGSTVTINSLLERKGVKTALITTKGFRDVLEIARGNRAAMFHLASMKAPPFVPRYEKLLLICVHYPEVSEENCARQDILQRSRTETSVLGEA